MTDDELGERIRTTLIEWAAEARVSPIRGATVAARSAAGTGRRTRWITVAAACAVAVIAAGAILWNRVDPRERLVEVGSEPTAVSEIAIGLRYGVKGVAVTDGAVWVTSVFDEELYRIDPATNRVVATYPIPSHVEGVTAAGGWLWLSRYDPHEVVRVDPANGALTARLAFDSQPALAVDSEPGLAVDGQPGLAVDTDTLWAIADRDGEGRAMLIDTEAAATTVEIPLGGPPGFAAVSGDSLWVAHHDTTTVSRIDIAGRRVSATVDVGGEPRAVVATGGAVWVGVNPVEGAGWVARIDPGSARVTATIPTGRMVNALAAQGDELWVTNMRDGTLSVIDTGAAELVATSPIGDTPGALAVGHGSVWLVPHRDAVVLRIDPALPLEAAARPDVARNVTVGAGTVYVRCSGAGSPTVVLEADAGHGAGSWALVEARLARRARVCATDGVGVADPEQLGQAGPAATVAAALHDALGEVGERGPFVVVGKGLGGLNAQMFATLYREQVVGLVLVNSASADFYDRILALLPADAREKFEQSLLDDPVLQFVDESADQVAAAGDLGAMPLVVIADPPLDPVTASANSDPALTVEEIRAIDAVREATQQEQTALSSKGRLVRSADPHDTPGVVVDEVLGLLG